MPRGAWLLLDSRGFSAPRSSFSLRKPYAAGLQDWDPWAPRPAPRVIRLRCVRGAVPPSTDGGRVLHYWCRLPSLRGGRSWPASLQKQMDFASAFPRVAQGKAGLPQAGLRLLLLDGSGAGGVVGFRGGPSPAAFLGPREGLPPALPLSSSGAAHEASLGVPSRPVCGAPSHPT